MEKQEVEYDDKMLILAEWLETSVLSKEEILLNIVDEGGNEYNYDGENYLVLSYSEVNLRLEDYSDDMIDEIQRELNRSDLWYSHYLIVDSQAVSEEMSIEQIGEYNEFRNYYIFTL